MKKRAIAFCAAFFLAQLAPPLGFSANWTECNDRPVRLESLPTPITQDLCSIPEGSLQERAFFSAVFETGHYVTAFTIIGGHRHIVNGVCLTEHGDGLSEVSLVNRADIDGVLGRTLRLRDGCTFPWEEAHIAEADVMVAADLAFDRPDESSVVTDPQPGTKIGALAMLHEFGHALGLEHSTDFAVMRNGTGAGVPFVGMRPESGGLNCELTGDDVLGISRVYGYDPSYRNLFVSSQILRNGQVIDNNIDPTRGDAVHPDPVLVCPGDKIDFFVSVGNDGSPRESFRVAVYADPDPNAYTFPSSGALALIDVSMGRGQASFPVSFTVPAGLPANVTQNVFVAIETDLLWERKGYDNFARSRLRFRLKPTCP